MRELNQSITFTTPPHTIVNHVVILRFYVFRVANHYFRFSQAFKISTSRKEPSKRFLLVSIVLVCVSLRNVRSCFKKEKAKNATAVKTPT